MFEQYDDILTFDQLMEVLAIGRNKAYNLLQTGEIDSLRIGRTYRVPKECIRDYVMKNIRKD
ncbi:DNA-binding protein [Paenibacillus odorifer]|uniref:helix-turn-helix domain-containing protein n=1 Tax=Paenibacillus odorifer TaxID=189426 RepID=UPI00096CEC2F|nr:helix-turn-helix domain-containing protein [Paenibacillus odorifer]OMC75062.1 DNA-binding protein [Paenibacillus odorifer]